VSFPAPRLWVYPKETVIAEKFQALVDLGMANSRMKDLFDLDAMGQMFAFEGKLLDGAISATFARWRTKSFAWLSPDGRTLYFNRNSLIAGGRAADIWVSHRSCDDKE